MKRIVVFLLFILFSFPNILWAKFSKEQTVTLLNGFENEESMGSLEQLLPPESNYAKKARLIGKIKIIPVSKGLSIIQIAWTGVCSIDDLNQRVAFDKPMTSFFKAKHKKLHQKPELPIDGELIVLQKALEQLDKGQIDKENLKKKQSAKNPSVEGRHLLVQNTKNKNNSSNMLLDKSFKQNKDYQKLEIRNTNTKNVTNKDTSETETSSLVNHSQTMDPAQDRTKGALPNFLEGALLGTDNREEPLLVQQGLRIGPPGRLLPNRSNQPLEQGLQLNQAAVLPAPSLQRPMLVDNNANQVAPLNARQGVAAPLQGAEQRPMLVDNNANQVVPLNARQGVAAPLQGAENNPLAMANAAVPAQAPEAAEEHQPEVTYQVTEEGCNPRVDRVHERVIIQNRTKKFEDGTLRETGECTDSLEVYPIMKDFLCAGCTDSVNMDERKAYSRYQEYWFDRENQKHVLGEALYPDIGRPYHFVDEQGSCEPLVDLQAGLVNRQVESVYYNFNNTRMVAQNCHQAPNQTPIRIVQTADGCRLSHDFARNVSFEQKKSIYTLEGVVREVLACRPVGDAIPHEFVASDCQPVTNLSNNTVTQMVKRKIRTALGSKIISQECEPAQASNLLAARDECQGQYYHDLTSARSYIKKAYYYMRNNARNYVTPCVRTSEYLPHQSEIKGYAHDDANRFSRPYIEYFIQAEDLGRITADAAKIRGDLGLTYYVLLRNEHRPVSTYFEGCYRRTRTTSINIYQRADGSLYEQVLGEGNIIASGVDECSRRQESRDVAIGNSGGNFWRHGRATYAQEVRTITTYPNGSVYEGGWVRTGYEWQN